MKLSHIILIESFGTAQQVFSQQSGDPDAVAAAIKTFRELGQRNKLKPEEKDITKWIKAGWDQFNAFIGQSADRTSGKEARKSSKKDSIRLFENDRWLVVIPLSKDASCFYGKHTKWCTAATTANNKFDQYFKDNSVTLVYFLDKQNGGKWAMAKVNSFEGHTEYFDVEDKSLTAEAFFNAVGMTEAQVLDLIEPHTGQVDKARSRKTFATAERAMWYAPAEFTEVANKIHMETLEMLIDNAKDGSIPAGHLDIYFQTLRKQATENLKGLADYLKDCDFSVPQSEAALKAAFDGTEAVQTYREMLTICDKYFNGH